MRRAIAVMIALGLARVRAGHADESPSPEIEYSFEWRDIVEPTSSDYGVKAEFNAKFAKPAVEDDPEAMPKAELERLIRELLVDAPPAPMAKTKSTDQQVEQDDSRPPQRPRRSATSTDDDEVMDEPAERYTPAFDSTTPPPPPDDRGFLDVVLVGTSAGYHCTAVLISPTVVLTAAHCAPATQIAIAHRVTQPFARVTVAEAFVHPEFDAAVLRLTRDVPVSPRIRRRSGDRAAPVGVVRLVGFGVDDVRHPASFGVKRRVDAVTRGWGCDRRRARAARCRPGAEMVLTAVGGGDTCRGDSGGPVFESTPEGYRLIAIVSRATATGGAPCGRGGVYVRVDAIDAWLTSVLGESR